MIISPPFLPSAQANESDAEYVKRAMTGDAPGSGAYPVSNSLGWHGGLHLEAPMESDARLSVRAIADGKVKYVRQPKAMPDKLDESTQDPLYYHSGWTDNGVVVIEHKTDIGEGASATNVVFYSIYLHLHTIARSLPAVGKTVWRKDEIGQAGYIYGKPNLIHFEIICDAENLKKLINRDTGKLDTSKDGRTDSVWGEIYVKLPSGAEVKATDPQAASPAVKKGQPPAPPPVAASLAPTTEDYFIGIRYERGHCITSTYKEDGTLVAAAIDEAGYEYGLYEAAAKHFKACPSAGYEMLRFGRVLGPDALSPADAPHWRKINTAGGHGYVNLNTKDAKKFSDADFPEWKKWKLIEDDTEPDDSRCDSPTIRSLINPQSDASTPTAAASTPNLAALAKLHRTICKFPTEWDKATIAARWGWLKDQAKATDADLPVMTETDFSLMTQHMESLCFWDEAGLTAIPTPWHFEPREFVIAFKQCGWLSQNELIQLFPKTALRKSKGSWVSEGVTPSVANLASNKIGLNKALRKFGIVTPLRIASFYANAFVETGWLRLMEESLNSKSLPRYYPWQGRGFMQLTWPDNYVKYWNFLGRNISSQLKDKLIAAHQKADKSRDNSSLADSSTGISREMAQWRDDVSSAVDAAGSAGAYWAWSGAADLADIAAPFVRETKAVGSATLVYYTHSSFGQVAATVNVGHASTNYASVNGIVPRFQAFTSCIMVLAGSAQFPDAQGKMQEKPEGYIQRRPI